MIGNTINQLPQDQGYAVMNVAKHLRVQTTWIGIWRCTVTKSTSVRVATKSWIERYIIYRDIFQNIIKYFELILSIYMIWKMHWTGIWKCTSDGVPTESKRVTSVARNSTTFSRFKPTNACPSGRRWETYQDVNPASEKAKNWWTGYVYFWMKIFRLLTLCLNRYFPSFKNLQDLRHQLINDGKKNIFCGVCSVAM